jgi:hypothetical protein
MDARFGRGDFSGHCSDGSRRSSATQHVSGGGDHPDVYRLGLVCKLLHRFQDGVQTIHLELIGGQGAAGQDTRFSSGGGGGLAARVVANLRVRSGQQPSAVNRILVDHRAGSRLVPGR